MDLLRTLVYYSHMDWELITKKHRESKKHLFDCWRNMRVRCDKENNPQFKSYGGRGIRYTYEWRYFRNFYSDMRFTWREGLSLDRIDNNGNYCYENCRWATAKEQNRNRRDNVYVTILGEKRI